MIAIHEFHFCDIATTLFFHFLELLDQA